MSVVIPSLRGAIAVPSWAKNELWRKAAAVPSLDLRFADSKSLVDATTGSSLVTFTRASSGTYTDSAGVLQTAVTNLVLWSEDLTVSPWIVTGTVAVTADSSQGLPFAGAKVFGVQFSDANEELNQSYTFSALTYTPSIWVKGTAGETIRFAGKAGQSVSNFTLDGTWQRFTLSPFTAIAGTANFNLNTAAGVTARTIYVAAPQLEQSATVGEYIPTTSTINSAPRFDHNPTTGESLGLLVEEQRTNLLLQSEDFSNVAWVVNAATVTTNTQTAPNGTLTADTFSPTSGTSSLHQIITCLASTVYTWTFYIKLGTMAAADFRFAVRDDSNGAFIATDIVPNVTPVTTEWRRVTYTFTTPVGCVLVRPYPYRFTPATYGTTVHLWGAQLEAGSFPTSYIPTTTAAVTRSADVASITGSAFTSFYNQSQLTLYLDLIRSYSGNFSAFFNFASLHDGTASNSLALYATQNNQNVTNYGIQSGGVVQNDFVARPTNFPGPNLIAQALATNSSMFAVNGVLTTEDTSITMPVGINQLRIGSDITGLAQWGGTIRRLTFWPQRLANSTLQNITT